MSAEQAQQAPGNFVIPAKVDILLVVDDTGSMLDAQQLPQQIPSFLTTLQGQQWDYHFATIPLTSSRAITQVMASQYDPNWGSQWLPPYPGASAASISGTVDPSVFTFPSYYTDFSVAASNAGGGQEPGLKNIYNELVNRTAGTGFMRPDALLVVLMLGNGADTSGVTMCQRSDSLWVAFENAGTGYSNCKLDGVPVSNPSATAATSFTNYKSLFQSLRSPTQFRFFAAMDPVYASFPTIGSRYQNLATQTGGAAFNLNTTPLSSVLSTLSSSLQATKLAMRTRYLFIAQAPEVSTVQVTKYLNGDLSQAQIIPQDATNGWTYAGYLSNVYAVDSPTNLNLSSGYAIELHGTAKLVGSDTANVTYMNQGAQNSGK